MASENQKYLLSMPSKEEIDNHHNYVGDLPSLDNSIRVEIFSIVFKSLLLRSNVTKEKR